MRARTKAIVLSGAALLTLVGSGCGQLRLPWLGRKPPPAGKNVLGIRDDDERFREVDADALDNEAARAKNGLRVTLRTDKTAYRINEPILVDVRLENVTSPQADNARDIPIYFEPTARVREGVHMEWLFKFQIHTERDQRLIYRSPEVKVPVDNRDEYYHYVILPPQSFVGRRFIFWPSRARGLTNPGKYSVVAAYIFNEESASVILNPKLSADQVQMLGPKLAYVRVWTGQIMSNPVTFQVKRKRFLGIF